MRDWEEIKESGQLKISTLAEEGEGDDRILQMRAMWCDPVSRKRHWVKFTKARGWEHLCVAGETSRKLPSWEVLRKLKDLFWLPEEACVQYFPRESEAVSNAECLHIWRPIGQSLPEPDPILVGIKGMSQEESEAFARAAAAAMPLEQAMEAAGIKVSRAMRRMKR